MNLFATRIELCNMYALILLLSSKNAYGTIVPHNTVITYVKLF